MSNKVTFEAAVSTLESMFPDWDRQDLENMLVSNRNHVENTIDAIFQVGAPPRPRGSSAGRATPAASATPPSRSSPATKTHSPYGEPYRGRTVQLPDDFLRPPAGFVANNLGFDDEQLSMLLQVRDRQPFATTKTRRCVGSGPAWGSGGGLAVCLVVRLQSLLIPHPPH